jgi:hypothetical protein
LPRHERPHRLEFVGAILVMVASSSFMLALNLGGVRYPWLSLPVIALLGCTLILGVGFVFRLLTAVEPLIPIAILADPAARYAIFAHAFGWGSIVGLNIFLPMYLQTALGWSATDAGLSLVVMMVTLNTTAGLSSQLIGRMRHYKAVPIVCLLLALAAIIALGFWADRMTPLTFGVLAFLLGVGFGPTAPLTQVALQNTVASHHFGTAIGTMNFSRNLFSTILVAVFGAIVLAGVSVVEPVGSVGGLRTLTATSPQVFAHVFYTAAATLVIALVSMILLEEKPLLASLPAGEDLRARGAAPGD